MPNIGGVYIVLAQSISEIEKARIGLVAAQAAVHRAITAYETVLGGVDTTSNLVLQARGQAITMDALIEEAIGAGVQANDLIMMFTDVLGQ